MAQIGSLVLNVTDINRAATLWRNALGYVPREGDNPGALVHQRGEGPALLLDETERTHLDLHVASEQEQRAYRDASRVSREASRKASSSRFFPAIVGVGQRESSVRRPSRAPPLLLLAGVSGSWRGRKRPWPG
jgi:hypothetical protein